MTIINIIAIIAAAAIVWLAVCIAIYKKRNDTRADLSERK